MSGDRSPNISFKIGSAKAATLGAQLGIDLSVVSWVLRIATGAIIDTIIRFTGNT